MTPRADLPVTHGYPVTAAGGTSLAVRVHVRSGRTRPAPTGGRR